MDDFADLDRQDLFQDGMDYKSSAQRPAPPAPPAPTSATPALSSPSTSFGDQSSYQSRKEKANAAVMRAMPLAERARPATLDDYIGQKELIGPGGVLRALVLQDTVP